MKKLKIFSLASKFESTTNIFNNKIYLNNIKKKLTTKKKK